MNSPTLVQKPRTKKRIFKPTIPPRNKPRHGINSDVTTILTNRQDNDTMVTDSQHVNTRPRNKHYSYKRREPMRVTLQAVSTGKPNARQRLYVGDKANKFTTIKCSMHNGERVPLYVIKVCSNCIIRPNIDVIGFGEAVDD